MKSKATALLDDVSLAVFEITKITWVVSQRVKGGEFELTESEFLTLDALQQNSCLTVGDLQRQIHVLPAQMSRIIKGLETKYDEPLISCTINPDDKRKIDVRLTDTGNRACDEFRNAKIDDTRQALAKLPPEDLEQLDRITRTLWQAMQS